MGETGVAVDEYQQSSVAGVYCAGEVTGIGGLDLALAEGSEVARIRGGTGKRWGGAQVIWRGAIRTGDLRQLWNARLAPRAELRESWPTSGLYACRCEDVTLGRIRQCSNWREAKLHTRCGMGPCQGRVCGPAVEFLLGWKAESVRPPVFAARGGELWRASRETSKKD